jgi:hypothetical protein
MSGFLASIPTWDVMLCAAGFCFLIVCLLPCRLIHAAWRDAFLMVLYVLMAMAIIAGFVYGMGWVAPVEPAGFVHRCQRGGQCVDWRRNRDHPALGRVGDDRGSRVGDPGGDPSDRLRWSRADVQPAVAAFERPL